MWAGQRRSSGYGNSCSEASTSVAERRLKDVLPVETAERPWQSARDAARRGSGRVAGFLVLAPSAATETYPLGWHERFFASGGELHIEVVVRSLQVSGASWQLRLSVTNQSALRIGVRPRFALVAQTTYSGSVVRPRLLPIATGESWPTVVIKGHGRPAGQVRIRLGAFYQPLVPGLPPIVWVSRHSLRIA